MKTTESNHICPFPGLRSFTEDESLYFKGRDLQVDQITALLEQNKFLMVTGASGEGKSSLIYAGLIPNARAGFFKAKYSNWLVSTFRPERTPLANMAASLAEEFHQSAATIETELCRGYSSLIDLYTNSNFYAGDEEDATGFSDGEKKERKRKAANLIILVDQFEEFFTSPENFINDVPSTESQTVINLILETARIAIKRNLPVYVVCTMRSDYIGQCSAFRGLPEYIGFSQFFVPRLKRKDLKQVIEEPAILSGNRISQRLIERLVFDIAEGVDQLPILQHALSQVWLAADHGEEEMDLIHYAIAGGMSPDELPEQDLPRFNKWIGSLPAVQQNFYKETGLHQVIDIHANLLYENAWQDYNRQHPDKPITQQEAKRIIALSFSCLTKIDHGRAVRNRMTLAEITRIINTPNITEELTGEVLNIFREEGNSFIHPFKTDNPSTQRLSPGTVLDITHESLIRNWNKLNQWATKEFEFYSTYLDFKKQIDRWVDSGKKNGYLLPMGPLTYFENWYKSCKPNPAWIARYSPENENTAGKSETILSNIKEFLKKSGRREILARTVVRYGPRRIAIVVAILAMLSLSSFYLIDANRKKNDKVIERVQDESFDLLKSSEVNRVDKANFLLAEERFKKGTLIPYLEKLEFKTRLDLAIEVYKQLVSFTRRSKIDLRDEVFDLIKKNLSSAPKGNNTDFLLTESNRFLVQLALDNYFNPEKNKELTLAALAGENYDRVLEFFRDTKLFRPAIPSELNMAIHFWLTTGKPSPGQISALIKGLSPLEGPAAILAFNTYYAKGSFEPNGRIPSDFNGGYVTLASLYAALGEAHSVKWCFEQFIANNMKGYFETPRLLNNHLNVIGYFYQFGHRDSVKQLLQWITANSNDNPAVTILRNIVIRSGYISHLYPLNFAPAYFYRSTRGYIYPNLYLMDRTVFDQINEDYDKEIMALKDPKERDFTLALNAKRKAVFYSKYWYDRNMKVDTQRLNGWFRQFISLYSSLDDNFLNGTESSTHIYNIDGVRTGDVTRRSLLLYPDYNDGWFSWAFHTDYFFNFLHSNGLLEKLYKTNVDLQLLHYWIANASSRPPPPEAPPSDTYYKPYFLPDSVFQEILQFVDHHPEGRNFDKNLLILILANRAFDKSDTANGIAYFHQLNFQTIGSSIDRYEYLESIYFRNSMKELCGNLAAAGKTKEAVFLAESCPEFNEKAIAYTRMAERVYRLNADPKAFEYLDSAYARDKRVDFANILRDIDPRRGMIKLLSQIGSSALNKESINLVRDLPEEGKFNGILSRVAGVAYEGNFYRAYTSIPNTLTESQDLQCRTYILLEECKRQESLRNDELWRTMDNYFNWYWDFVNYLPN